MAKSIDRQDSMHIFVNHPPASIHRKLFDGFVHTHFLPSKMDWNFDEAKDIFVLSSALGLTDVADVIHKANAVHRLRAVIVFEQRNQNWVTRMMDEANLRTLRNLLVHSDWKVAQRILSAWKYGAETKLIADAAVFGDLLYVQDCALNTYKMPFSANSASKRIPAKYRFDFVISDEGSHISWPLQDVDFDLDSIKVAIDPKEAAKSQARQLVHNTRVGAAIERIRKGHDLNQNEIDGLSDRQLRRIERGEQHATVKSLECLANAHKLPLQDYLNLIAETGLGVD